MTENRLVTINLKSAESLVGSPIDPYCSFSFDSNRIATSSVASQTNSPVWQEEFVLPWDGSSTLKLNLFAKNLNDFPLGEYEIDLAGLELGPDERKSLDASLTNVASGRILFDVRVHVESCRVTILTTQLRSPKTGLRYIIFGCCGQEVTSQSISRTSSTLTDHGNEEVFIIWNSVSPLTIRIMHRKQARLYGGPTDDIVGIAEVDLIGQIVKQPHDPIHCLDLPFFLDEVEQGRIQLQLQLHCNDLKLLIYSSEKLKVCVKQGKYMEAIKFCECTSQLLFHYAPVVCSDEFQDIKYGHAQIEEEILANVEVAFSILSKGEEPIAYPGDLHGLDDLYKLVNAFGSSARDRAADIYTSDILKVYSSRFGSGYPLEQTQDRWEWFSHAEKTLLWHCPPSWNASLRLCNKFLACTRDDFAELFARMHDAKIHDVRVIEVRESASTFELLCYERFEDEKCQRQSPQQSPRMLGHSPRLGFGSSGDCMDIEPREVQFIEDSLRAMVGTVTHAFDSFIAKSVAPFLSAQLRKEIEEFEKIGSEGGDIDSEEPGVDGPMDKCFAFMKIIKDLIEKVESTKLRLHAISLLMTASSLKSVLIEYAVAFQDYSLCWSNKSISVSGQANLDPRKQPYLSSGARTGSEKRHHFLWRPRSGSRSDISCRPTPELVLNLSDPSVGIIAGIVCRADYLTETIYQANKRLQLLVARESGLDEDASDQVQLSSVIEIFREVREEGLDRLQEVFLDDLEGLLTYMAQVKWQALAFEGEADVILDKCRRILDSAEESVGDFAGLRPIPFQSFFTGVFESLVTRCEAFVSDQLTSGAQKYGARAGPSDTGRHELLAVADGVNAMVMRSRRAHAEFVQCRRARKQETQQDYYFENARYLVGRENWVAPWYPLESKFTDYTGQRFKEPPKIALPSSAWRWTSEWEVDMNAVIGEEIDADGWEYGSQDFKSFAVAGRSRRCLKSGDCIRRRRWVRTRLREALDISTTDDVKEVAEDAGDDWAGTDAGSATRVSLDDGALVCYHPGPYTTARSSTLFFTQEWHCCGAMLRSATGCKTGAEPRHHPGNIFCMKYKHKWRYKAVRMWSCCENQQGDSDGCQPGTRPVSAPSVGGVGGHEVVGSIDADESERNGDRCIGGSGIEHGLNCGVQDGVTGTSGVTDSTSSGVNRNSSDSGRFGVDSSSCAIGGGSELDIDSKEVIGAAAAAAAAVTTGVAGRKGGYRQQVARSGASKLIPDSMQQDVGLKLQELGVNLSLSELQKLCKRCSSVEAAVIYYLDNPTLFEEKSRDNSPKY